MTALSVVEDVMPEVDLEQLADDWFHALRRQNFSPRTLIAYSYGLRDWIDFVDQNPGNPLTRAHLEAWQDSLLDPELHPRGDAGAGGLRPRSRQLAVVAVRGLLKWAAVSERPVPANLWLALDKVRIARLKPRPLSRVDEQLLIAYFAPEPPAHRLVALRDRATFFYLLGTSARVSDMLQLERRPFAADVQVIQKGGTLKTLRAPLVAMEAIAAYLAARKDTHPALFVTHPARGDVGTNYLDEADVRQAWRRASRKIGIPYFTTHRVRHTTASILLRQGVSIETIATVLGHSNLQTVMGYAEIQDEALDGARDAMQEHLEPATRPRVLPRLRRRLGGR